MKPITKKLTRLFEAFTDYHEAVANGQSEITAYDNLTTVLNRGMEVWKRQFSRTCRELQVGR
jgi:hypothetical protein